MGVESIVDNGLGRHKTDIMAVLGVDGALSVNVEANARKNVSLGDVLDVGLAYVRVRLKLIVMDSDNSRLAPKEEIPCGHDGVGIGGGKGKDGLSAEDGGFIFERNVGGEDVGDGVFRGIGKEAVYKI